MTGRLDRIKCHFGFHCYHTTGGTETRSGRLNGPFPFGRGPHLIDHDWKEERCCVCGDTRLVAW